MPLINNSLLRRLTASKSSSYTARAETCWIMVSDGPYKAQLACYSLYVTGPGKTDHVGTFIVLRTVNMNNSLSYNSAVVNSRGMKLALEIQHLFSFKQKGLIIADSLSCLILGGFYWHGCNIRSVTYKGRVGGGRRRGWEGGNRSSVKQKTPRGTSSCSHMPNKPPQQSQTTTEDEANPKETMWAHAILLKPPRGPSPSVLAFQWFAWPRKSRVEKQTWPPLVILSLCFAQFMNVSMIWSNKMHFNCCAHMVGFPWPGHI